MNITESQFRDSLGNLQKEYVRSVKVSFLTDTLTDIVYRVVSKGGVQALQQNGKEVKVAIANIVDSKLSNIEQSNKHTFFKELSDEATKAAEASATKLVNQLVVDFRNGDIEEILSKPSWFETIEKEYFSSKTTIDEIALENVEFLKDEIVNDEAEGLIDEVRSEIQRDVQSAQEKSEIVKTAVGEIQKTREEIQKEYDELRGEGEADEDDISIEEEDGESEEGSEEGEEDTDPDEESEEDDNTEDDPEPEEPEDTEAEDDGEDDPEGEDSPEDPGDGDEDVEDLDGGDDVPDDSDTQVSKSGGGVTININSSESISFEGLFKKDDKKKKAELTPEGKKVVKEMKTSKTMADSLSKEEKKALKWNSFKDAPGHGTHMGTKGKIGSTISLIWFGAGIGSGVIFLLPVLLYFLILKGARDAHSRLQRIIDVELPEAIKLAKSPPVNKKSSRSRRQLVAVLYQQAKEDLSNVKGNTYDKSGFYDPYREKFDAMSKDVAEIKKKKTKGLESVQSMESFYFPGATKEQIVNTMIPLSPTALRMVDLENVDIYENTFLSFGGFAHREIRDRFSMLRNQVDKEMNKDLDEKFTAFESLVNKAHDNVNSWINGLESMGLSLNGPLPSDERHFVIGKAFAKRVRGLTSYTAMPRQIASFEDGVEAALDLVQLKKENMDLSNPMDYARREAALLDPTSFHGKEHQLIKAIIDNKFIKGEKVVTNIFVDSMKEKLMNPKTNAEIEDIAYQNSVAILSEKFQRELGEEDKRLVWRGIRGESVMTDKSLYENLLVELGKKYLGSGKDKAVSAESIRHKAYSLTAMAKTLRKLDVISEKDVNDLYYRVKE